MHFRFLHTPACIDKNLKNMYNGIICESFKQTQCSRDTSRFFVLYKSKMEIAVDINESTVCLGGSLHGTRNSRILRKKRCAMMMARRCFILIKVEFFYRFSEQSSRRHS